VTSPRPASEPRSLKYHADSGARPLAAGRIIVIGLVMFTLAGLFNADSLYAQAKRQPFGWQRSAMLTAVRPVRWISHTTRLNRPRADLQQAIGRPPVDGPAPTVPIVTAPVVPTAAPIILRRPTATRPLKLWVGGDSMSQEIGTSVVEAGVDRGTIKSTLDYRISTGLSRPDYFDWPAELARVVQTKPEVMVVIFGANDAQSLEIPADSGNVFAVRTPQWQAEYRKRVGAVMDELRGDGRLVIWVGMPNMRKAEFSERMQILDAIYRSQAATRPWVRFLDTRPILKPAKGDYADYLRGKDGEDHLARQSDGIHLSRYGADLVSDAVYALLDREVATSLANGGKATPGSVTTPIGTTAPLGTTTSTTSTSTTGPG